MALVRVAPIAGTIGATGLTGPLGPAGPTGVPGTSPAFSSQPAAPTSAVAGDFWFDSDAPSQNVVHPFLCMGA